MATTTATGAGRGWRAATWAAASVAVFALGAGEAAAQLTADSTFDGNGLKVDVATRVTEGASATITVTVKASVAPNTETATDVTVTVITAEHGAEGATNEGADVSLNPGTATLSFPANTTGSAVTRQFSGRIVLQTSHDPDAEDETVVLAISTSGGLDQDIAAGKGTGEEPLRTVTLDDDEIQSYVLAQAPGAAPREGARFDVAVSAEPDHVDNRKTLTLQIDSEGYTLDTEGDTPGAQISGMLDGNNPSFTATVPRPPMTGTGPRTR